MKRSHQKTLEYIRKCLPHVQPPLRCPSYYLTHCILGEIGGDDEEEVPYEIISPEVGTVVKLYSVHTK